MAAYATNRPRATAPATMYQVTAQPMIWHTAKNATSVTAMDTTTARILVGILFQVTFFTTWVMMLVITVRISAASRMADTTTGMYCIMFSTFMSSSDYFTAPPSACSSRSREGNVS